MTDRASELRTSFDRGFGEPLPGDKPDTFDYLRVRVAGEPFALALTEIASLHVDLRIAPMPSPARELLGLTSLRARLVPIYDLRLATSASAELPARWIVLVRGGAAGFAFDGFDGFARTTAHATTLVILDGRAHPVIGIESLLNTIQSRWVKESSS